MDKKTDLRMNLFSIGTLLQDIKINEAIGETIEAKIKNKPQDMEISRKRSTFNIRFGKSIKALNHFVKQYEVYITFETSEEPEGNIYEIHDEPLFFKFNKSGNWGFFEVRKKSEQKRLGKFISEFLEANGIKLTPLSKAEVEYDSKTKIRLLEEWILKNV